VSDYGSSSAAILVYASGEVAVTGNATVSGFGAPHIVVFCRQSGGLKAFGEGYREKTPVEGDAFRDAKAYFDRIRLFSGF
jgi:hypothetical protein